MVERSPVESGSLGRRSLLLGAGSAALAAPLVSRAEAANKTVRVSVGRIPWSAFNSPMSQYMINNKLFEKRGAELGYDVKVEWRDYPTALPMVEAIVGAKLPVSLMVVGEGHMRFVLATRNGSPIRRMEDLRGKTVGALLGGDPYNALLQMMRYQMGSNDPRKFGIRIINTPTLAQAAQVPTGMDAAIAVYPSFLAAESTGTAGVINSFGYTQAYYQGPLGKGGGILLPSVKKSPFYPEGYYLHRSFWLVHNALVHKNPDVVVAFVMAQQDAVSALKAMQPGPVSQLVRPFWKLDSNQGAKAT